MLLYIFFVILEVNSLSAILGYFILNYFLLFQIIPPYVILDYFYYLKS
jgi:hypothetical protein